MKLKPVKGKCKIKGCKKPAKCKQMCATHYGQDYKKRMDKLKPNHVPVKREKIKEKEPWETSGFFAWDNASVLL